MLRLLGLLVIVVVALGAGTAIAVACHGGSPGSGNAGNTQYGQKPGCGPDKSDGLAGKSGYHDGQPPKDHERKDCPKHGRWDGHDSGHSDGSSDHGHGHHW